MFCFRISYAYSIHILTQIQTYVHEDTRNENKHNKIKDRMVYSRTLTVIERQRANRNKDNNVNHRNADVFLLYLRFTKNK